VMSKAKQLQPIVNVFRESHDLFKDQYGNACAVASDISNAPVTRIKDMDTRNEIRQLAFEMDLVLKEDDITEICKQVEAFCFISGGVRDVYTRVAPVEGGVEIDF